MDATNGGEPIKDDAPEAATAAGPATSGPVKDVNGHGGGGTDDGNKEASVPEGEVPMSQPSVPPPSSPPPPPPPPNDGGPDSPPSRSSPPDLATSSDPRGSASTSSTTTFEGLWEGFREAKRRKDLLRGRQNEDDEEDDDDKEERGEGANTEDVNSAAVVTAPTVPSSILVNFIDPTAAAEGSEGSPLRRTAKLAGGGGGPQPRKPASAKDGSSSSLELYERLAYIFSRTYGNRISHVSVSSPRTGAPVTVKEWNVRTVLVPSHGGLVMSTTSNSHTSNNNESIGSSTVPVPDVLGRGGDPTEWHRAPYCHVYMVTCDSLEAYRTKVKPSVMVFLSQIGANAEPSNGATAPGATSSSSSSSHSPPAVTCSQYVIVFVPTLSRAAKHLSSTSSNMAGTASDSSSDASSTGNPIRLGSGIHSLGSRLAAARQLARESLVSTSAASNGGGTAESPSSGVADDDAATTTATRESLSSSSTTTTTTTGTANSLSHLSKVDRELAKRLAMDFPMGNVCVLTSLLAVDPSSLSEQHDHSNLPPLAMDPVHRQEWQIFLKALSSAVMDGFADRCRRYQQELKDHDRLRTLVMSSSTEGGGGSAKAASSAAAAAVPSSSLEARVEAFRQRKRLDLGHYFLLKESLALTYEQVGLVGEALMEYDELKAVVPELGSPLSSKLASSSSSKGPATATASLPREALDDELCRTALRGDVTAFRRRLHAAAAPHQQQPGSAAAAQHWSSLAPVAHRYLFARATTLLFQMDKSVDVVGRCVPFIESLYRHQLFQLGDAAGAATAKALRLQVEREAFELAWDIKRACDCYLAEDVTESTLELDELDRGRSGVDDDAPRSVRGARRKIDEALAKAVCDLVEFARLRLLKMGDLALDDKNPIRNLARITSRELKSPWAPWKPGTVHTDESATEDPGDEDEVSSSDVIGVALSSPGDFMTSYLELLKVLEAHCRFSGRRRCASRWCVEMAGLHIMRGEHHKAALALRLASKAYAEDRWEACHFFLLFRLAGYQRKVSTADDYLDTLVRCFGACRVAAPPKALDVLLADLEAVLRSTWLSRTRLAAIPIFDPVMGLDGFKPSSRSGSARDLLKKVYNVGDKASVNVTLESFLPKEIEVDALSVDLVPFQTYVSAMEDSLQIKDEELFAVLAMKESVIRIRPGVNVFSIDWIPMVSGQFILARTTVTWKSMKFTYTAVDLKRPVMRVDVLPSEPTQALQLSPNYLLPGHKQPIKVSFRAGSDIVSKGALKLVCSPGLLLLPPDQEDNGSSSAWAPSYESPLPPCRPGETVDVVLLVHCSDAEKSMSDVGSHSVHASVRTWYRPPFPTNVEVTEADEAYAKENLAEHELQASVSTTGARAIALHHEDVVPYSLDKALLQVALRSNCPAQITLSHWEVSLPTFLEISSDLNDTAKGSVVAPHEIFYLTFDCSFSNSSNESSGSDESSSHQLSMVFQDCAGNQYMEAFALGLRRCAALKQRSRLPRPSRRVPISVEASRGTGSVGQPIDLVIKVDASPLTPMNMPIRYLLEYDPSDWMVHGRSEGLLLPPPGEVSSHPEVRLEFTIVPCRPGAIPSFPVLQLFYCQQDGGSASVDASAAAVEGLDVTHVPTLPFVCQRSDLHTSVACAPSR